MSYGKKSYSFKPTASEMGIQIIPIGEKARVTGLSIYSKNTSAPGYVSLRSGGNGPYAETYYQERGVVRDIGGGLFNGEWANFSLDRILPAGLFILADANVQQVVVDLGDPDEE